MSIANLASGDSIDAQFNPSELEEALEVDWTRHTVPGLSHQPLQYVQTHNTKFTVELYFEAQDPTTDLDQILRARRFLQSLCYPRRGAQDVLDGGPPRVLFLWPTVVSLTCVVASLGFKYSRFNLEGTPVQFTAKLSLEEIRDVRLVSEDVLATGTQRSGVRNGVA
ncbi:MAG TPA: peptidoglycan-binding protein [Kofleriaceae bacterium]|nr:peptidoglycan-binding protein [Kofleriaceae bacterium]